MALLSGLLISGVLYLPQAMATKGEKTLDVDFSQLEQSATSFFTTIYQSFLPYPDMNPPEILVSTQKAVFIIMAVSFFVMTFETFYRLIVRKIGEPRGSRFLPVLIFALLFSAAFLANPKGLAAQSRHILPLYTPLIAATAVCACENKNFWWRDPSFRHMRNNDFLRIPKRFYIWRHRQKNGRQQNNGKRHCR